MSSVASNPLSLTVENVAPLKPVIAGFSPDSGVAGDGITSNTTPVLSGSAEAGSTIKIYDGSTLLGSVTANASGAWSYTTPALSNGGHSITVTATDAAGNVSVASDPLSLSIDTAAPTKPVIAGFSPDSGVVGDGVTSNTTPVLSGSAEAGSTIKIYDGSTLLGSVTANVNGAWSYTTPELSDGGHSITVTATDAAGNVSLASNPLSLSVDSVAPTQPLIAGFSPDNAVLGDGITGDRTPTLGGSAEAGATVNIYDGSTLLGSVTANASGAWSYTTPSAVKWRP